MKIRNGFVSNSSSSSFVCCVCGEKIEGRDISLYEYDMVMCENGHIYCTEHAKRTLSDITKDELLDYLNEEYYSDVIEQIKSFKTDDEYDTFLKEFLENFDFDNTDQPACLCPVCNLDVIENGDAIEYATKKYGITKAEVFAVVKENNKRRRKLYDSEYFEYLKDVKNISKSDIEKEVKELFGNDYQAFYESLIS